MTGPQTGAGRRAKGVRAEVEFVNWLRNDRGYVDARRYLAGDGRQPGDIDGVPGLVIDVKNRDGWRVRDWLEQVELEAAGKTPGHGFAALPGRLGVVVARLERVTNPAAWPVILRADRFFDLWEAY